MSGSLVRRQVIYTGMVQGVGFRYTALQVARRFTVTGFVRNLPNGTVELVVEGSAEEADRYLRALAESMAGHIEEARIENRDATGEFPNFDIVR